MIFNGVLIIPLQLQHFLDALVAQLRQFESALNGCSAETFLKMGTLYQESLFASPGIGIKRRKICTPPTMDLVI